MRFPHLISIQFGVYQSINWVLCSAANMVHLHNNRLKLEKTANRFVSFASHRCLVAVHLLIMLSTGSVKQGVEY